VEDVLEGQRCFMIATLRQRNFSLLWFAGLISLMGNWMLRIALPVLVYQMTGSALAVGGMLLAQTVPSILFSTIAGVFVDRWERRRTIVIVNALLALSILPLLLVRSVEWLWLVYLVSFIQSALGQFFAPAENAMLPLLSDQKLLVSANALNALNNNLARLVGPAIGGLVAALVGIEGVVAIDALTYIVAAVLAALISVTSHPGKSDTSVSLLSPAKIFTEWLESVRLIWREKTVRTLFVANIFPAIGESVMYVLYVPFVTEILHGDSVHVGGLMSAQAIGGIFGGLVISWIAPRMKTYQLLGFSAVIFGLLDFALFNYSTFFSSIVPAYFFILAVGPFAVGIGAGYSSLFQSHVDDAYRGRVFGTFSLTSSVFTLVGIVIAGFAGDSLGIVPVINVQSYAYILMGVICLVGLGRKVVQKVAVLSVQGEG
jgi:MFS family permease